MNKKRKVTKRLAAWFLCLAMVLTTINLPAFTTTVKAEETPTAQAPSVTAFATKDDLVKTSNFTLYKDATHTGVAQKVNFGNGKTWYIAGSQNESKELVLICDPVNPLNPSKVFNSGYDNKRYESSMGTYENYTMPENAEVYPNHYGASEIRAYLTSLYGDGKVDMFSSAEQEMMENTKVYTKDFKNNENVYSTSDKLYLAYGDFYSDSFVTVGANSSDDLHNGIVIGLKGEDDVNPNAPTGSPYATADGTWLWLRAPLHTPTADEISQDETLMESEKKVLCAKTGLFADCIKVDHNDSAVLVVPAFNMNLSTVLFASAATTASDNTTLSDVMTFRMDGTGKVTSLAVYDNDGIKVTKGGDDEYIYIQYNDETGDKVWSKSISSGMNIYKGCIGVDSFENCKIWIEKKIDTENLTYAVMANSGTSGVKGHDFSEEGICKVCDFIKNSGCLTFTAVEANSSVTFNWASGSDVRYSTDGGSSWNKYTAGTEIKLENQDDAVSFKGSGVNTDENNHFTMTGKITASGDVTSLTNGIGGDAALDSFCYQYMFKGCTSLTSAPTLPAMTLAVNCYQYMFKDCTSLTSAPVLPATTLAVNCYQYMFKGCTSLTSAPSLPATTLANKCYLQMFYGCTSLTSAPSLPAMMLADSCYQQMFYGCTSLISAPSLPATTLENICYSSMFYGCTSLTNAPTLPATTLTDSCYYNMFNGCSSLTKAPELPATMLANECYSNMFKGCTSLTEAPELPATTLANSCYKSMFRGCTSLISVPALPATMLADSCYYDMFNGCTSLTKAPSLPATTLTTECYKFMFYSCTSLASAPELPATTLADSCYYNMFYNCTSLTEAPELPATTLADSCYYNMFAICKNLTKAPELPATTLADSCYNSMFEGCIRLTGAPELPATTLADSCYYSMFKNCNDLIGAPELPATTLADSCYYSMFKGCISLTKAPELKATTLADSCYYNMFNECTSLKLEETPVGIWEFPGSVSATDWNLDMITGTKGSAKSVEAGKQYKIEGTEVNSITYELNGGSWVDGYTAPNCYVAGTGRILPTIDNISKTGNDFLGWYDNAEFTGSAITSIDTSANTNKTYYAKWHHNHGAWNYSAENNSLKATCGNPGCTLTDSSVSLTITANSPNHTGSTTGWCEAGDIDFILEGTDEWGAVIETVPTIHYTGTTIGGTAYSSEDKPTVDGSYTAYIECDEKKAELNFQVGHVYEGQTYEVNEDGIHHNQKCKYCDYVSQGNHDFYAQDGTCKTDVVACESCGVKNIAYKGLDVSISTPKYNGAAQKPTVVIKDGETTLVEGADKDYTVTVTEKTAAADGAYDITVTGVGDYAGSFTKKWSIDKADPDYTEPSPITIACNKTLKDITLPDGFTFENKDATLEIGKANTVKVIFTPTDTDNYNVVEDISMAVTVSGHVFDGEDTADKYKKSDANCKDKAVYYHKCSVCGEKGTTTFESGEVNPTNHKSTLVSHEAKAATCMEKGNIAYWSCVSCEKNFSDAAGTTVVVNVETPINPDAHKLKAVAVVPATCKTTGTKAHYVCEIDGCGKLFADAEGNTEITDATTLVIEKDLANHTGETEIKNAKEATCKEPGYSGDTYCKDCGAKLESGSETNQLTTHKYDEGTVTKEATCTEDGVLTKTCSVCGVETTEVIKAKGHTEVVDKAVAPTCTETGLTEGKHCSDCKAVLTKQETVKATGHKWDNGTVTKQPTVTAEGVKTFKCTNTGCNETKTESIAKLPEPKKNEVIEDKTGNDYKVTDPAKKEVTYKAPADKKAKTITIPASVQINGITYKVTKVDDKAFKGNTTVTKVTIPSSVTVIGAESFSGCKNLTTVSIPKNVTTIGKNAFKGCAKLTKVTLPSKCTKIGAGAFDGCKKMKTITIKSTKLTSKSVSAKAFKGLSKNVTIKVPKKQLKAYKKLLKKKGFKGKVK